MNPHQLKRLFPHASKSVLQANACDYGTPHETAEPTAKHDPVSLREVSDPEPKSNKADALERPVQGEAEGVGRVGVRFTLCRVRPLDPDNAAASCKDLLDGLVRAKILPGDAIWQIEFSVRQEKVPHYAEEQTVIDIYRL